MPPDIGFCDLKAEHQRWERREQDVPRYHRTPKRAVSKMFRDADKLFHALVKRRLGTGAARVQIGGTESEFRELASQWKEATKFTSSATEAAMHPAYQRIIGMGREVLPLILRELSEQPGHWFWALQAITGENPVRPEDQGRVAAMREAWLDWATARGLIV